MPPVEEKPPCTTGAGNQVAEPLRGSVLARGEAVGVAVLATECGALSPTVEVDDAEGDPACVSRRVQLRTPRPSPVGTAQPKECLADLSPRGLARPRRIDRLGQRSLAGRYDALPSARDRSARQEDRPHRCRGAGTRRRTRRDPAGTRIVSGTPAAALRARSSSGASRNASPVRRDDSWVGAERGSSASELQGAAVSRSRGTCFSGRPPAGAAPTTPGSTGRASSSARMCHRSFSYPNLRTGFTPGLPRLAC